MDDYKRPAWLVPVQYNEAPPIPERGAVEDDDPIDYSKGPDRSQVFGEDLDDGDEPETEGGES